MYSFRARRNWVFFMFGKFRNFKKVIAIENWQFESVGPNFKLG